MAENQPVENQQPEATPEKPPLMGYATPEALVQAKVASDAEAKRLHGRVQELEQQLGQVLPLVTQRQPGRTPYDELSDLGIPTEALRQAVQNEARVLLREELAPLISANTARQELVGEYPEYQKFEPQLHKFLAENPQVNEQYEWAIQNARQKPEQAKMAMEWAYLKFGEGLRRQNGVTVQAGDTDPAPAAIPSSSAQDRSGSQGKDDEAMKRAFAYGKQYGDWRAYAHERLKGVIPDSHFQ